MRKSLMILTASFIFLPLFLSAQPQRPGIFYNPETVVDVKGEIQDVEKRSFGPSGFAFLIFTLKTDTETIRVNVDPEKYVTSQGFSFAKGDKVEVKGSKVEIRGENVIIAAEIKKADKVLKLRDENGRPLFAGPRGPRG